MALREPAWRVTARELESSLEEERGTGDRAASHVLSPFGARMNRVLIAGTVSVAEPIGRETPQAFWRARLTDPTGAVAVTAGSFQPRAMAQLRAATVPRSAIVVGKVHLYRDRGGVGYVSVRAEAVRTVAEADERAVLADTVRQTLDRLDLLERIEKGTELTDAQAKSDGIPFAWVRAARDALRTYPNADRPAFRLELRHAVRRVAGDSGPVPSPRPPAVTVVRAPPPRPPPPPLTAAEREEESVFLDLLDEVAEVSSDGYADLKELLARVAARGVEGERAEATLNRLEEEGVVEEPIVGKLRRA